MTYKRLFKLSGLFLLIAIVLLASARMVLKASVNDPNAELKSLAERFFNEEAHHSRSKDQRYFEDSFSLDAQEIARLEIHTISTDIEVRSTDRSETRISFVGWAHPHRDESGKERPWVRKKTLDGEVFEFDRDMKEGLHFDISTSSEPAHRQLITIELGKNVQKALKVQSVSADLELTGLIIQSLELKSVSGDIKILKAVDRLKDLRVETVSGEQEIDLSGSISLAEFDSVSGDIHLMSSGAKPPRISFNTTSGDVSNDQNWPLEYKSIQEKITNAGFESEGVVLNVKTVSGDLSLTRN